MSFYDSNNHYFFGKALCVAIFDGGYLKYLTMSRPKIRYSQDYISNPKKLITHKDVSMQRAFKESNSGCGFQILNRLDMLPGEKIEPA